MNISARNMDFKNLNERIRSAAEDVIIDDCYGQRFIGCGLKEKTVTVNGIPGNALGAYLDGAELVINGNAQDAVGDTMNAGKIVIDGNAGDALGYAMRGGSIFVRGNSGYRTGIHMKEYRDKKPVIAVGGKTGSFLGEYLAGGLILVLGLGIGDEALIGNFSGAGMHGGRIFIRTDKKPADLPQQVIAELASKNDMKEVLPYIREFAKLFNFDADKLSKDKYYMMHPNGSNPYKQLYTVN